MDTQIIKQSIHELVEKIDDKELLNLYLRLLKREVKQGADIFTTTEEDMVNRARLSLASVESGKTRSIKNFRKEIEAWKNTKATS